MELNEPLVLQINKSQIFENVYELKLFMHNLQIASGTKYKIEKVDYFTRYTEQYDRFMYKRVVYRCCGLSQERPCFSFVLIETRGDFLQIVDCYSVHTHSGQTTPRILPSVTFVGASSVDPDPEFTRTFKALFDNASFRSFDQLQKRFSRFYEMTGAVYMRRHTTKLPLQHVDRETCVYRRLTLECKHSGTFKSRSTHGVLRKSGMINCPSRINFTYENGALKILNYNLRHNHLLSPAEVLNKETSKPINRRFLLSPLHDEHEICKAPASTSNGLWSLPPVFPQSESDDDDDAAASNPLPPTEPSPPSRLRQLMSERKPPLH